MSSILESIAKGINANDVSTISGLLGVDDATTRNAIGAAVPGLVAALSKATEDPQKSAQLAEAVNRHANHTGSLLDQIGGLFKQFTESGNQQVGGIDFANLIPDLLGSHEQRVENGVAKSSGLNSEMAGKLIKFLGPMVVGVIAKQLSGKQVDSATINSRLNDERDMLQEKHPDLLGKLFDQDHDGDFDMSDMAKVFMDHMSG